MPTKWISVEDVRKSDEGCLYFEESSILDWLFNEGTISENRNPIYEKLISSMFETLKFPQKREIFNQFDYIPSDYRFKFRNYESFVDDVMFILNKTEHKTQSLLIMVREKIIISGLFEKAPRDILNKIIKMKDVASVSIDSDKKLNIRLTNNSPVLKDVVTLQEANINLNLIKTLKRER